MNDRFIIFECAHDLKQNILATAVVSSIKKAHPDRKIIVVTSTPEVWLHNPNVYRFYGIGRMSYFYDDFVNNKDVVIMRHNPMVTDDFMCKRKHLIEIWCDLCRVPYDGSLPKLFFTWREHEAVTNLTASDKPLFFIQTNAPMMSPNVPHFWATDIPLSIAQKVVDAMNEKGYASVHVRTDNQPALLNVNTLAFDPRLLLCAINRSSKRLLIDSYMMQAATAFKLPSVVAWIAHDPKIVGYEMHKNISAHTEKDFQDFIDGYTESFVIGDAQLSCLYDLRGIFDPEKLIKELLE